MRNPYLKMKERKDRQTDRREGERECKRVPRD